MIETCEDLCTAISGLVDDLYTSVAAPQEHRPRPHSLVSDSEVITFTLMAEVVGLDAEKRFLVSMKRHDASVFPVAPERSRFHRRRRALTEVTTSMRRVLQGATWDLLTPEERSVGMRESLPAPVLGFHHAQERHRWPNKAT